MKRKTWITVLMLHTVLSGTLLAGIRVWQQSYNTTHREPICMASLDLCGDHARLSLLGKDCTVPLSWLAEDSPAWYAAYLVTDGAVKLWVFGICEFITCS